MNFNRRFKRALTVSAKEFGDALDRFDPMTGIKAYPERMVSYYYIRAIVNSMPGANVFLEFPVTNASGRRQDNHIDALIFNSRELVMAEFKLGWSPGHLLSLTEDFDRLRRRVAKNIRDGFKRSGFKLDRPRRAYILLGTDCWRLAKAKAWKTGERHGKQKLSTPMRAAKRDFLQVYDEKGGDYDGYYLAWAVASFDRLAV